MARKSNTASFDKVPLYDAQGKKSGVANVDKKLFTGVCNLDLLYYIVRMYRANRRAGLAATKVRNEVSGGGKKPWRQKGTGRARVSSIRSPIWRGGGVVFGPHPRSFKYQLPKKTKRVALVHSLNSKLNDGTFNVITELSIDEPKTKKVQEIIDNIGFEGTTLLAVEKKYENLTLAARNIKALTLIHFSNINAFDVLRHRNFLITENGLGVLTKNLRGQ